MPVLDLSDETFLVAAPARVAAEVARPEQWARWWPDLRLAVFMDRGVHGLRWSVAGALVGSSEIWLEPVLDGVLLHYYLRADLAAGTRGHGISRVRHQRATHWKQHVWELKRRLEGDRRPGRTRVGEE